MAAVLDCVKTYGAGCLNILRAIVDEERRLCRLSGTRDGVVVDALVRLCDAETVREGAMSESRRSMGSER